MWRPKERIKYKPQPGPWPTREEAQASLLFSPVDVGPTRLRHGVREAGLTPPFVATALERAESIAIKVISGR